ncbi:MAG: hypothetical protein ACLVIY_03760 [Anaerobutyricum soehngenii]
MRRESREEEEERKRALEEGVGECLLLSKREIYRIKREGQD